MLKKIIQNDKPKIKIEKDNIDKILMLITLIAVGLIIYLPISNFSQLPTEIPNHFGLDGKPDDYSDKNIIFLLPIMTIFITLLLQIISKFPHTFNFPIIITEENAPKQYKIAIRMILWLNASISFVFLYITYITIQVALGKQQQMSPYFVPIFLGIVFIPIGISIYNMYKNK